MSGIQKLLLSILTLFACAFVVLVLLGGLLPAAVFGALFLGSLMIARPIWHPTGYWRTRIALATIAACAAIAIAYVSWRTALQEITLRLTARLFDVDTQTFAGQSDLLTATVVLAILALLAYVNYIARDRTTARIHPSRRRGDFSDPDYTDGLCGLRQMLESALQRENQATSWSEAFFEPLDADVETATPTTGRVSKLLAVLRRDYSHRVFLVLGDPGAGKSVALRKVALHLLGEVKKTGKVPLYINLRHWRPVDAANAGARPTAIDLQEYILRQTKQLAGDVFVTQFLDRYYEKMLQSGRFVLLLDSFDEIPAVLDASESSAVVSSLSDAISSLVAGTPTTRAIVSSRLYRQPRLSIPVQTLRIRPFSDRQIANAMRRAPQVPERTLRQLFARPELARLARNPFTAALVRRYAETHGGELPDSMLEMYDSYIQDRLRASRDMLAKLGLTVSDVTSCAAEVAVHLFSTGSPGLDAQTTELVNALPDLPVEQTLSVLRYARLGRLGEDQEARFSFVHRRFAEFFVAQRFLLHPQDFPFDAVPADSRWRDALVLYCEVSSDEEARKVARSCWSEVRTGLSKATSSGEYSRAIHCLRFLHDAFYARAECMTEFREELGELLTTRLASADVLETKLLVEASGVLEGAHLQILLTDALESQNAWVRRTALRSCQHLEEIDAGLEVKVRDFVYSLGPGELLPQWRDLLFSLGLSPAFARLRRVTFVRGVDFWCASLAALPALLILPLTPGIWIVIIMLFVAGLAFAQKAVTPDLVAWMRVVALMLLIGPWLEPGPDVALLDFGLLALWQGRTGVPVDEIRFLLVVLLVPWSTLYILRLPRIRVSWPAFTEVAKVLAVLCIVGGLVFGLMFLAVWAPKRVLSAGQHDVLANFVVWGGNLVFFGWPLFLLARAAAVNRWRFRSIRRAPPATRREIEAQLALLYGRRARLRYVSWLDAMRVVPVGEWTKGIPGPTAEPATTRLAQLEERWLGLSR